MRRVGILTSGRPSPVSRPYDVRLCHGLSEDVLIVPTTPMPTRYQNRARGAVFKGCYPTTAATFRPDCS